MANASVNVAIAEPRAVKSMANMVGDRGVRSDAGKEASKSKERTFAEALKEAGKEHPKKADSSQAKKTVESSRQTNQTASSESTRNTGSGKKTKGLSPLELKTGKTSETVLSESDEDIDETVDRSTNRVKKSVNGRKPVSVDASGTGNPDAVSIHGIAVEHLSRADREKSSVSRGAKDSGAASVKSKQDEQSSGMKSDFAGRGLSGKSGRVEIVDKREFKTPADVKSAMRDSGKLRGPIVDSQTAKNSSVDSGTVKTFDVPVGETEIELSSGGGKGSVDRPAAAELARKLDAQAGSDIVRQVKIVLGRADAGEVRINLRPDNLGRVRVQISMEDNRLTGRIFVESAAAREAFRSALDGLQAKLVESGFGSADLELAWDDSGSGFADRDNRGENRFGRSDQAARDFENMVPTTIVDEMADSRVNMVV